MPFPYKLECKTLLFLSIYVCTCFSFSCSYHMPVSQGLKLVFPVDNSLQGCYKQRESCVARDFSGEVGFSFFNFGEWNIFFLSARPLAHQLLWSVGVWPEVVGFVWQGGGDGNWGGIVIRFFYSDFRPLCFRSIQLCFLAASRQTLKYTFRFSQTLKKTYFWQASRKPNPSFWRARWPRRGKAMLGCIQQGWLCCNCKRLPIKSQTLKKILNKGNVFNRV